MFGLHLQGWLWSTPPEGLRHALKMQEGRSYIFLFNLRYTIVCASPMSKNDQGQ